MLTTVTRKILKKIRYKTFEEPQFKRFENSINVKTIEISKRYENELIEYQKKNVRPPFQHLFKIHSERINDLYLGKHRNLGLRVLIHTPSIEISAGGYSLFMNMAEGMREIGVPVETLAWDHDFNTYYKEFKPNVFLTSDSAAYLSKLPWKDIRNYVNNQGLKIGLTASIERYGSGPLSPRLSWAKETGVSFYYSFRTPEYINQQYQEFLRAGFQVASVEFAANPKLFFPMDAGERDLDFCFFASTNYDKWPRYFEYLKNILNTRVGVINGPGWSFTEKSIPQKYHSYIYNKSRVGINLHISDSTDFKSELNERTYILAACGVPQLIDFPLLLPDRFSSDSVFASKTAEEYEDNFQKILDNPDVALERSLNAYNEVMSKHTNYERALNFLKQIQKICFGGRL